MLRRAPTSISLSNRDVTEHLESIERKKRQNRENIQPNQGRKVSSSLVAHGLTDSVAGQLQKTQKNDDTIYECGDLNQQRALRGRALPFRYPREIGHEGSWDESPTSDVDPNGLQLGELSAIEACTDSENEENRDPIHPAESLGNLEEGPVLHHEESLQQSSRIPRTTFDYGGFVDINADQSSSFRELVARVAVSLINSSTREKSGVLHGVTTNRSIVPQDFSTPRSSEMPESHRLRSRYPLPRSPLFRAEGANSPERRLMASLTPRMASYGTPSLLLSQLARRPRSYRPRTISYSFEESERASAAYEQVQGSDNDFSGGQLPRTQQRSLQEELEAGSSQSASLESNMPSSPPEFAEMSLSRTSDATPGTKSNQRALSLSPQLPLPPPFSAARRNFSLMAPLSSAHGDAGPSRSTTPMYGVPQLLASPIAGSTRSSQEEEVSDHEVRIIFAEPRKMLTLR